jgi:hypothetical protein
MNNSQTFFHEVSEKPNSTAISSSEEVSDVTVSQPIQSIVKKKYILPSPGDLVDALQDPVHEEVGKVRLAKSARGKKDSVKR